ncbi:cell wall hydrolase [Sphingomonas donggukensis]|uniref:Cell wall hydrolase n=1 Tax=Sphingomonas donggukensis TaxID=2949093 RepID=A0ABY4TTI8_9SPHN|nr:cell wall hydrolase [Sphingomonas donggukensis]URW75264.1 cell wall hydrolase [Sphingomonas donggukensis]
MSLVARAATFAAVTFCAGFLLGTTTPGFAQELSPVQMSTLNALAVPQVPTIQSPAAVPQDAAPAVARPAVVQVQPIPTETATAPDEEDFDSLSEAVAAQDHAIEDREMRCLAAGVFFESKGEPLTGQLAVAQTIINRTKSGRFPKSICSVLTQRGQFSFVRGGVVPSAEGRSGWTTAVAIAKVAARDLWDGAADSALFFHARRVAPGWRMQKVAAIGNHVFYR